MNREHRVECWLTPPHECSYLSNEPAASLVANPGGPMNMALYSELVGLGFRRSGSMVYRPHCPQCRQCQSVRIPVSDWRSRRRDRRCLNTNADLRVALLPAGYSEEHYQLYLRYCAIRHSGSDMDGMDRDRYSGFLWSEWSDTTLLEARLGDLLIAVAVMDLLTDGVSAVYTFFDPEQSRRGLGHWAILQQIELARSRRLSHVYLGYWIADSPKMAYKANYRPLEHYIDHQWQAFDNTAGG